MRPRISAHDFPQDIVKNVNVIKNLKYAQINNPPMAKTISLALGALFSLSLLLGLSLVGAADSADLLKIEPSLLDRLESAAPEDTFIVWVIFTDRPKEGYDSSELPYVNADYVERVSQVPGVKPRYVDEILNALSVEATADAIYEISAFSFVSGIRSVPFGCAIPEGCTDPTTAEGNAAGSAGPFGTNSLMVYVASALLALLVGGAILWQRLSNRDS
jgi:hypothetical protein